MMVNHPAVKEALNELADESFQRRLWLAQIDGMVGSFTECVEGLFSDSALDWLLEKGVEVYGAETDRRFRELGDLLRAIDGYESTEEILEDPRMDTIRAEARALLQAVDWEALPPFDPHAP